MENHKEFTESTQEETHKIVYLHVEQFTERLDWPGLVS